MIRILAPVVIVASLLSAALVTWASPPNGVTPTLIGRGTYDAFKVDSEKHAHALDFKAKARDALDIVVRQHDYAPESSTGWHTHPGPVFITVLEGEITFYEYGDPSCTPIVVSAGQGYVDTGHGHIARNEQIGQTARDITVILAPVGESFRGELPAPGPYCGF
jgi:hypothetical protein